MPGPWHPAPIASDIVIIFCALFELDWVVKAPICRRLRLRAATVGDYLGVLAFDWAERRVQRAKDIPGLLSYPAKMLRSRP